MRQPLHDCASAPAQAAKRGVREHAGTPREFTTITVTDGIAMGHAGMKSSLVTGHCRLNRANGAGPLL